MSKPEKSKVTVTFGEDPVLEDLDLPGLLKEYKANIIKETFHKEKMEYYAIKRSDIKDGIKTIIETVHADTVLYTDSMGGEWKSTLVQPGTSPILDENLLRSNMMRLGKLPAPVVAAIFEKSTVPGKPKAAYVKVTVPNGN